MAPGAEEAGEWQRLSPVWSVPPTCTPWGTLHPVGNAAPLAGRCTPSSPSTAGCCTPGGFLLEKHGVQGLERGPGELGG